MHSSPSWDYPAALRAIWERSGYDRGFVSNPFAGDEAAQRGLKRTAALLDRLGRPQERYGILHVAGSKGKGSTCAFAASILHAAGYRVGLFTSPHLHTYRERIAVNGAAISEAAFAALTQRAVAAAEALEAAAPDLGAVTAFELTTAMALDHFAAAGCDLAVVEVGLGGRLDATNVVTPLVAAITALDLEHTAVLGDTLPAIARQKAGIIKPGRPVVVSPQAPEALTVIAATAERLGSPLSLAGRDWQWTGDWCAFAASGPWGDLPALRLGLPGAHQIENAATALAATWLLGSAGYPIPPDAMRAGLAAATWPGRFERAALPNGATAILDGAHTPASAAAFAATIAAEYPERRAVLVLGVLGDKDPAALAAALAPVTSAVIAAESHTPRAVPAARVADVLAAAGRPAHAGGDVAAALRRAAALAGPAGLVLVTGSLTVVAEAREALGLAVPDPSVSSGAQRH